MSEHLPRIGAIDRARNFAYAICESEALHGDAQLEPFELRLGGMPSGKGIQTVVAKWYDPERDHFCYLRRNTDNVGQQYFMAVYPVGGMELHDEPQASECYLLLYATGVPILATDAYGTPVSSQDCSERVQELMQSAVFSEETFEQRSYESETFREIIGRYALISNDMERQIVEASLLPQDGEKVSALWQIIQTLLGSEPGRGLSRDEVVDAIMVVQNQYTVRMSDDTR